MEKYQDIIFSELEGEGGNVGEILLNRPKALNALTLKMCTSLSKQLLKWKKDPNIKAVIIKGSGDRAFCAGGDIRNLYELKQNQTLEKAHVFFEKEYKMNADIFHFPKPFISFLNGITMGGGAGVSIHGSHRVATEKFIFAMPEASIGFFTDIGSSYFLTRCPHKMGWLIALTGNKIKSSDAHLMGLVTHVVSSEKLNELEKLLLKTSWPENDLQTVSELINSFHQDFNNGELWNFHPLIEKCFQVDSVESVIEELNKSDVSLLQEASKNISKRSPTSLKVIWEQLNRAKDMKFDAIMKMEYIIALHFLKSHDFFEGIRAVLIDKDQTPKWNPDALSKIAAETIQEYFLRKE